MKILYSPSSHLSGNRSGFYFENDIKCPSDAFEVSSDDHNLAINQPSGFTYDFPLPDKKLVITPATNDYLLSEAKNLAIGNLYQKYMQVRMSNVKYTSQGGITGDFQADQKSTDNLQALLVALQASQSSLPKDFFWVDVNNNQIIFTYVDMQLLAQSIAMQGILAFNKMQQLKSQILSATSIQQVTSITW